MPCAGAAWAERTDAGHEGEAGGDAGGAGEGDAVSEETRWVPGELAPRVTPGCGSEDTRHEAAATDLCHVSVKPPVAAGD